MFSPMSTFYYWEENREEIYRSAPTRVRVCKRRRARRGGGGGGGAAGKRLSAEERENGPECISHGQGWKERFEQLMCSLRGRILPDREDLNAEMASVLCSCDDRDREKCREAAKRFGFTIGSNLPPDELTDRMRFIELYFHNILNSPQFTEEYINSIGESVPYNDVVRALFENRLNIFALVQRCVFHSDLKAYRLLDVIRQYIQKPCQAVVQVAVPSDREEALEWIREMEKNDHFNLVQKIYGSVLMIDTDTMESQNHLDLCVSTANMQDLQDVQSYFVSPIGVKLKEPEPEVVEESEQCDEDKGGNDAQEEGDNSSDSVVTNNSEAVDSEEKRTEAVNADQNSAVDSEQTSTVDSEQNSATNDGVAAASNVNGDDSASQENGVNSDSNKIDAPQEESMATDMQDTNDQSQGQQESDGSENTASNTPNVPAVDTTPNATNVCVSGNATQNGQAEISTENPSQSSSLANENVQDSQMQQMQ